MAAEDGVELRISGDNPSVKSGPLPDKWTSAYRQYVNRTYLNGDGARYREEKAFAERQGLTMHVFADGSELPAEAFKPEDSNDKQ
jgi:hypothetical protein